MYFLMHTFLTSLLMGKLKWLAVPPLFCTWSFYINYKAQSVSVVAISPPPNSKGPPFHCWHCSHCPSRHHGDPLALIKAKLWTSRTRTTGLLLVLLVLPYLQSTNYNTHVLNSDSSFGLCNLFMSKFSDFPCQIIITGIIFYLSPYLTFNCSIQGKSSWLYL